MEILSELQNIFDNRELAIGFWLLVAFIASIFFKSTREFLRRVIPLLLSKTFITFYLIFAGYFILVIILLRSIGYWDTSLLKDTIIWVVFIQFPLFAKTIEKAKDGRFYRDLIKQNIALIVLLEFILNFWTFSLLFEIILIPLTIITGLFLGVITSNRKFRKYKVTFDSIISLFGLMLIVKALVSLIKNPMDILSNSSLKEFFLPLILLIFNLPLMYGLGLYSSYEQLFLRLKGDKKEKSKIKILLFQFSGLSLYRVNYVRKNIHRTIAISSSADELRKKLHKLEQTLLYKVGDNYMKKANSYTVVSSIAIILSVIGLIATNSDVTVRDLVTFNFIVDSFKLKEILSSIFEIAIVISISTLVHGIIYRQKQLTDISNVKKYVLFDLLYVIKKQKQQLQEIIPIEDSNAIFSSYLTYAYDLNSITEKSIDRYENLLSTWEMDLLKQLQDSLFDLITTVGIKENEFNNLNLIGFSKHFNEKVKSAPQTKDINTFLYELEKTLNNYSNQINILCEEFKYILPE